MGFANESDYVRAGLHEAWDIVCSVEVPPSLEVFESELVQTRRSNPTATPEQVARRLVTTYRRIAFESTEPKP